MTYAVRIEKMHPLAMAMLHYLVGASAMSAPAGLYSETARANLKYAIVTEPASTIAAKDESPRWQFRASGLVFSLIAKTPLYKKIKANAFAKMRVATESTGVAQLFFVTCGERLGFQVLLAASSTCGGQGGRPLDDQAGMNREEGYCV